MKQNEKYLTYDEVRRYLSRAEQTRGIRPGLSRMRQLMGLLGDPQARVRGILPVAGTNGKGSVLAFLDEILRRSGYRVTKYTSPAVFSYLERFSVDGQPVSEETFAGTAERVIGAAEFMSKKDGDPPTAFELETAIAYLIAAEADGDFFLMETGMGGRLDATNIEDRVTLSVISSVSMDHMAFLGNTVEEIAAQKAGIIKDGCPVVVSASNYRTGKEKPEFRKASGDTVPGEETPGIGVDTVLEQAAAEHRAPLYRGDAGVPWPLSLPGTYQQENAGAAFAAVRVLRKAGYHIPDRCVREGFANTVWPGRFEIVRREPLCVLDGAHNADAAERLAETLRGSGFAYKRKFLVLGVFKDKEYDKVVRAVAPLAEEVYVFTPDSPRGLSADTLAACVSSHTEVPVHRYESAEAAVRAAYRDAEESDRSRADISDGAGKPTLTAADEKNDWGSAGLSDGAGQLPFAVAVEEKSRGRETMVLCCGSLSYLGKAKEMLLSL